MIQSTPKPSTVRVIQLEQGSTVDLPQEGWRLGGVGTFGVVACVQEVAVTPGELVADADLIHYTMDAFEKDEEEAIRAIPNPRPEDRRPS